MRTYLDCLPCFLRQALEASRMATKDEKVQRRVLDSVMGRLSNLSLNATPPAIAQVVHRLVKEITGNPDPYKEIKKKHNEVVLSLYPRIKKIVAESDDRLRSGIKMAVAGNVIDLGVQNDLGDLEGSIYNAFSSNLIIDSYDEFKETLTHSNLLLYLGDNAGEIVFVVRENPVINDATKEDAEFVGMNELTRVVSNGSDAPATILSQCSSEVRELFSKADMIIAKGQGNYESLSKEDEVFFLLKAKCPVVARDLGVDVGDTILKGVRGDKHFVRKGRTDMSGNKNPHIRIREADRVEVTTIIDNYSDHTLPMSERPSEMTKRVPLAFEGKVPSDSLLAEHGLSLFVKVFKDSHQYSVLLDAGWSKIGVPHNIKELGVDVSQVEAVVISHGHMDHFGALTEVLEGMVSHGTSVIIHPDAFLLRALSLPSGEKVKMPRLEETAVEKTGARVVKTRNPQSLASGLIFSLGEVERITDFEKGLTGALIEREGRWEPDSIMDDHGLVISLKGKGLVVITGCAHSGIINTVRYAQKITGVDTVYAVMGGFHLTGSQFMPLTERTIEELRKVNPSVIIPMHCTCWVAINQIARKLPEQFKLNSVGTTFCL